MNRIILKCISAIIILFASFTIVGFTSAVDEKIVPNVYINNISVGNMTKTEAIKKVNNFYKSSTKKTYVILTYGSHLWRMTTADMKMSLNIKKAVDEAYAIGHGSNTKPSTTPGSIDLGNTTPGSINADSTTPSPIKIENPRRDIKIGLVYDKKAISNYLENISGKIYKAPINPILKVSGKKFTIIDGKNGMGLDKNSTLKSIEKKLSWGKVTKVILSTEVLKPKCTKDNLLNSKDKLGEYTTRFNASDVDRSTNIKIAAGNVNNLVVMPNEIVSVNKVMGPRLEKYGFRLAHVIVNNELVDGLGGGICQVSSTLYNALLLSNLKIIERKNHSIPSAYVALGRDATVSGNSIDLKFQNNTSYPIYIYNEVKGSHITFKIYGKNAYPNRSVKIKTHIISVKRPQPKIINDPTLPKGKIVKEKKSYSAYVVESFREILENGKVLSVEPLSISKYPLINGLIRIGTKK